MPKPYSRPTSKSHEDYLKCIWQHAQDGQITTRELAAALGVADASVSGMLSKLQQRGFISHRPYYGAQLTLQGKQAALGLLRRHRLIETFLIRYLGYDLDEVHEEAEALEHSVSDRFTERLAARLGHPTHDPHGDPIPGADGQMPDTPDIALSALRAGQTLEIARLKSQDKEILSYLAAHHLQPGARVQVVHADPLGEVWHISVQGSGAAANLVLSQRVARQISGRLL